MRIPGIKSIACAPCASLAADLEIMAASGQSLDLEGVRFTPITFVGEPVCNVESSNEHNGSAVHVVLSFNIEHKADYSRHCFVVSLVNGESFLIGSPDSIPSVSCKDITAGASTTNRAEITVELDSSSAWVCVETAPAEMGEGKFYISRVIDGGNAFSKYGGSRLFASGSADSEDYVLPSANSIDCGDAMNASPLRNLTSVEFEILVSQLEDYPGILNKIIIGRE